MTEAMISGTQLHNDILDGNAEKLKNICCKSNLPTIYKNHIFDGIDVSFIERDILKKSPNFHKSTRFLDSNAITRGRSRLPRSLASSPFGNRMPRAEEIELQKKFRNFEKDQHYQVSLTQLRRHPPPLKLRSRETPTSYNEFLTLESVPHRPNTQPPLPDITTSSVRMPADLDRLKSFPDFRKVQEHVARVRELLGRKEPGLETLRRRTAGERRGLLTRRIRTVGPEVLGSWDRAGSALSTRFGVNLA